MNLAALIDDAATDVPATTTFPAAHRARLQSTVTIERVDGEIIPTAACADLFLSPCLILSLSKDDTALRACSG